MLRERSYTSNRSLFIRNKRFWIPIILSVPLTLICVFIVIVTADFGFGSFFPAKLIFPYMMLTVLIYGEIVWPFNLSMFLQIPLYGVILGISQVKEKPKLAWGLLLLHLFAASLAVALVNYGGETVDWMHR